MNDLLFVYGTLMATAGDRMGRVERTRLARESCPLGPATTAGLLYDLGSYPGLVVGAGCAGTVAGELVRLADPVRSLRWLDAYEGLVPGEHDHNEYRRVEIDVELASGHSVRAWSYIYVQSVERARPVAGGSWLQRIVGT
jgi:gamma-glutamylcyclotransferase (GGCT)/AIG2-like uncharacterized protein YtfP